MWQMVLPVAGMVVAWPVFFGLGLVVGVMSGVFGVGGGFIVTPLMMTLGIPPNYAVGSDLAQIVGLSASGVVGHRRAGNVDMKFGLLAAAGGVGGGIIGARTVGAFLASGNLDTAVRIAYLVLLAGIGVYMFLESGSRGKEREGSGKKSWGVLSRAFGKLPLQTEFSAAGVKTSAFLPIVVGLVIGVAAGFMGVGGGVFVVPLFIYLVGMPTKVAVGTSLAQVLFTSASATLSHAVLNCNVDIALTVMLLVGSCLGVQVGVRIAGLIRGRSIRRAFSIVVLAVAVNVARELVFGTGSSATIAGAGTTGGTLAATSAIRSFAVNHPVYYGLGVVAICAGFGLCVGRLLRGKCAQVKNETA